MANSQRILYFFTISFNGSLRVPSGSTRDEFQEQLEDLVEELYGSKYVGTVQIELGNSVMVLFTSMAARDSFQQHWYLSIAAIIAEKARQQIDDQDDDIPY